MVVKKTHFRVYPLTGAKQNRQIGLALALYADDFRDTMPLCQDRASLGGKSGRYDLQVNETNKPLYQYQGTPQIELTSPGRGSWALTPPTAIIPAKVGQQQAGSDGCLEARLFFKRTDLLRPYFV